MKDTDSIASGSNHDEVTKEVDVSNPTEFDGARADGGRRRQLPFCQLVLQLSELLVRCRKRINRRTRYFVDGIGPTASTLSVGRRISTGKLGLSRDRQGSTAATAPSIKDTSSARSRGLSRSSEELQIKRNVHRISIGTTATAATSTPILRGLGKSHRRHCSFSRFEQASSSPYKYAINRH